MTSEVNVNDVGVFRFCPACGRPVVRGDGLLTRSEDPDGDYVFEDVRCSCCNRPWIACPCTPASEGACTSTTSGIAIMMRAMDNAEIRARAILREVAEKAPRMGHLRSDPGCPAMVLGLGASDRVVLDGRFTADELAAIVWWMHHKRTA